MIRRACQLVITLFMVGLLYSCEEAVSPPSDESVQFWDVMRDPQVYYYNITGSSGSVSSGIHIVNQNGIVLYFNGSECRALPNLPGNRDWNGIWVNPPQDIFAVGSGGAIARYERGRWEEQFCGTSADLRSAWGRSGDDVWVVGDGGTILHYDGSDWNAIESGTDKRLNDVHGLERGSVFAVGEGGTIVEVRGSDARTINSGTTNSLYAIDGTSEKDLCAVGANGTILRYDDGGWHGIHSGMVRTLTSVCATGDGQIYAAGGTTIMHYDGRVWETLDCGFDEVVSWDGVVDLYADISGRFLAVEMYKVDSFDGVAWKTIELPSSDENVGTLNDVWGNAGGGVYALSGCTVMRYDGIDWSMFMDVSSLGLWCFPLAALWGTSSSNIYTVGWAPLWDDGPRRSVVRGEHAGYSPNQQGMDQGMLIAHYDDAGLHTEDIGSIKGNLSDVWGASENDVFIVGVGGSMMGGPISGAILHYDGLNWIQMQSNTASWLFGVWGSSGSDVFAAGAGGTILHYDGTAWSPQVSGVDASLSDLWGSSSSDVFAVGNGSAGGIILHYDGTNWGVMDSPAAPSLNAVWGTSGQNVFAVGGSGTILHYDGTQWTAMNSPTINGLYSVWGSSADDIFVVGENGVVLHHGIH